MKTRSGLFQSAVPHAAKFTEWHAPGNKIAKTHFITGNLGCKKHRGWWGNRDKQRKCQGHHCHCVCLVKWLSDKMREKTEWRWNRQWNESESSLRTPSTVFPCNYFPLIWLKRTLTNSPWSKDKSVWLGRTKKTRFAPFPKAIFCWFSR